MQVQNILKSIYNELYSYIIEFLCKFVCMSSDRAMFLRILREIKIVPMSTPAYPPTPMIGMHRSRLGSSYIDQLCCTLLQIKTL